MNPPFSDIESWVIKANNEIIKHNRPELIVALLPAWTDRNWFHDYILEKAKITFLRGRIKFLKNGRPLRSPRFGCMFTEWR